MRTYLAIDLASRKFYVGSTSDFNKRVRDHLKSADNLPFQNALRKKPENFYWISSEDDGSANREEEQYYLDFYHGTMWCYNVSPSTDLPFISRERRAEIAKETHQKHPDLAKRMGEKSQEKFPDAAQNLQKWKDENPEKVRERAVNAGRASARKHSKPVICVETGEVFSSAKEAMRETGINAGNIGTACKSGRRAGGFHWTYLKTLDLVLV
jgi:group I intron endonuclease